MSSNPFSLLSSTTTPFVPHQDANPKSKPSTAAKKKRNLPGTPGELRFPLLHRSFFFKFSDWVVVLLLLLQIQMLRLLLCRRNRSWRRIDSYAKFATRVFKEIRIYNFTDVGITFRGSYDSGRTRRWSRRRCIFARRRRVYIMIHREPSATWLG